MVGFLDMWGGGRGPVRRLAPATRLLCGALVLATGLSLPLGAWPCVVAWLLVLAVWTALCGPPARRLRTALMFSLILFGPVLVLLALVQCAAAGDVSSPAYAPAAVAGARGVFCVVASVSTLATLSLPDLWEALDGLRAPRAFSAVIVQIMHQTGLLADESRRIASALRMRGAHAARPAERLRCVCQFPVVWLLRLLARAERVGLAMEVRGFAGAAVRVRGDSGRPAVCDFWARLLAVALLCASLSARILA